MTADLAASACSTSCFLTLTLAGALWVQCKDGQLYSQLPSEELPGKHLTGFLQFTAEAGEVLVRLIPD